MIECPCLPTPSPYVPLDEPAVVLTKTRLVVCTDLSIALELQSTPPTDPDSHVSWPRVSVCLPTLFLDLPMWPLEVCRVLLSESMSNGILCFKCIFELWLTIQHPVLYITSVNLVNL